MTDDTVDTHEYTDTENVSVSSIEEQEEQIGSHEQQPEHGRSPVARRKRTVSTVRKDGGTNSERDAEVVRTNTTTTHHHSGASASTAPSTHTGHHKKGNHADIEPQQEITEPVKIKKPLSDARKASLKKANETRMSMLARARELEKNEQQKNTHSDVDLKEIHATIQKLMKRSDKEKIRRRIEEKERFKRKRWAGKRSKKVDTDSDTTDEEDTPVKQPAKKQVKFEEPPHAKSEEGGGGGGGAVSHRAHQMPHDTTFVRRAKLADMIFG